MSNEVPGTERRSRTVWMCVCGLRESEGEGGGGGQANGEGEEELVRKAPTRPSITCTPKSDPEENCTQVHVQIYINMYM
jgi:hypothetical protein